MFCGITSEDNRPLLAAGAREAKLHFGYKVRNPIAEVKTQSVTTYCPVF